MKETKRSAGIHFVPPGPIPPQWQRVHGALGPRLFPAWDESETTTLPASSEVHLPKDHIALLSIPSIPLSTWLELNQRGDWSVRDGTHCNITHLEEE